MLREQDFGVALRFCDQAGNYRHYKRGSSQASNTRRPYQSCRGGRPVAERVRKRR